MKTRQINALAESFMQNPGFDWFMGYCPPMHEFKVHHELQQRGFVSFLPVERVRRKVRGAHRNAPNNKRFQWVDKVTWSGSLFFAMPKENERRWLDLRDAKIITSFVLHQSTGRPARISGLEMLSFVDFNRERFSDQDKPLHPFQIGDVVQPIDAALAFEAEIKAIRGNKARIEIDFMGKAQRVEIPLEKIVKAS